MIESSAPPQPPEGYLPVSRWRFSDFFLAFFAGLAGSIVVTIVVTQAGADPFEPIPFSLIFFAQAASSLVVLIARSRSRGTGSLAADTGLVVRARDWWGVPVGMGLQIAIAIVTLPLIELLFPDGTPEQGVSEITGTSETPIEMLLIIVSVVVVAPVLEEVLFRGVLLSILRRRLGPWASIVISAAAFSAVHLLDPSAIAVVPGLFILGVVLGWVALKRGDLSMPIFIHSGINLLAAISLLFADEILRWSETQLDQIEGVIRLLPWV